MESYNLFFFSDLRWSTYVKLSTPFSLWKLKCDGNWKIPSFLLSIYIYIHSMKRRLNLVPRSCRASVTDRGRFRYETNAARDFTKGLYSTNYLSPEGWEEVFAVCRMILAVSQWNLPDPLRRLRFPIIESQFSPVPHLYILLATTISTSVFIVNIWIKNTLTSSIPPPQWINNVPKPLRWKQSYHLTVPWNKCRA